MIMKQLKEVQPEDVAAAMEAGVAFMWLLNLRAIEVILG